MLKGQLSRVPWPGNSWMLQPHKHSYLLWLAIRTELITTLYELFLFCFAVMSLRGLIKASCGNIKALKWHLKWPLATSKWYATLCIPVLLPWGKCHQINNS